MSALDSTLSDQTKEDMKMQALNIETSSSPLAGAEAKRGTASGQSPA